MRVLALMGKDLLQIARDIKSAIILIVMPIAFTLIFGFAFSAMGAETDSRLPVGFVNRDTGALGAQLAGMLDKSDSIRLVVLEGQVAEQVDSDVQKGKLAAAVIVPENYSDAMLSGQPVPLTLIAAPGSPAGQTANTAVGAAANRVAGAIQVAQVSAQTVEAKSSDANHAALVLEGLSLANAAWQSPDLSLVAEKAAPASGSGAKPPSGFAQSSPGMIVQFAVFCVIVSAMILVMERKSRTLQRMLTTPTSGVDIIGGHLLAMFVVALFQTLVLVALGQFVFGVNYLREPLGTLLMAIALALWGASLGLLISAVSRKEEQVIMFSLIAMFFFAAVGGAWFPLEIAGQAFATVGHLLPTAWAMDGFQNIVVRGLGLNSTLLPVGMLLAYTAVFFSLALWRFRYE